MPLRKPETVSSTLARDPVQHSLQPPPMPPKHLQPLAETSLKARCTSILEKTTPELVQRQWSTLPRSERNGETVSGSA